MRYTVIIILKLKNYLIYITPLKIPTFSKILNSQDYNNWVSIPLWRETFKRLVNLTGGGIEAVFCHYYRKTNRETLPRSLLGS